jgi:uncharacterized membrane protein YhaH (DUF805 family)
MSFGTAVKTCFSKYATFSGRARRPEYWWLTRPTQAGPNAYGDEPPARQ